MNERAWRDERDDRSLRYAGRRLDPQRRIHVTLEQDHAAEYAGQVAALTLVNLLARMTPSVGIDLPDLRIVEPLPWAGADLRETALASMFAADPYGHFEVRVPNSSDYRLRLGRQESDLTVHGVGWGAYLGSGESPLTPESSPNPFGAAFAAILAAAHLFATDFGPAPTGQVFNTLDWSHSPPPDDAPVAPGLALGNLWTVGTGSVGTAVLHFLTLLTRNFSCRLFDMDLVKVHNLDRSPTFTVSDVGLMKVDALAAFLSRVGVGDVQVEPVALDEAPSWKNRQSGRPDILLAAANERNVRYQIESRYPPVQVYGTTGKNWQAAVIRHVPLVDACSKCLFPEDEVTTSTQCATDQIAQGGGNDQVDAALPFLSFAAGLMAAAEVVKLGLEGFPFSPNRAILYTSSALRLVTAPMVQSSQCLCRGRSSTIHREMIAGSRFARLSEGQ